MMYRSHATMGIATGIAVASYYNTEPFNSFACVAIALFGSFVPDIDHGKSYISRRIVILPWIISLIFEHRGFTHSFLFMAIVFYLSTTSYIFSDFVIISFVAGILSHSIGDIFTKQGVKLLWPIPIRVSLTFMKTGSTFEYPTALFLSLVIVSISNKDTVFPFLLETFNKVNDFIRVIVLL